MSTRWDEEAERAVLGAVILESDCLGEIAPLVAAADFHAPAHAAVFGAMAALHGRGMPIDVITLANELRGNERLNAVGGVQFLGALTDAIPTIAHVAAHAKIVRGHAVARRTEAAALALVQAARDPARSTDDLRALATSQLAALAAGDDAGVDAEFESADVGLEAVALACERGEQPTRWLTGFEALDATLGGLHPGTLNILAARPGVGKTSLAANVVFNASGLARTPCLMFSLEMRPQEIWQRLMAAESGVAHDLIRRREIGPRELDKMAPVAQMARNFPFHIHKPRIGQRRPDVDGIRALVRSFKRRRGGLAIVVVDYVQLAVRPGSDSLVERLGEITGGLKQMALEEQCAVLALSQLNRESTKGDDARPHMGQLRGSGSLEQDADSVTLLWRPKSTGKVVVPDGRVEAIVDKNRHGPTGVVNLRFVEWLTKFEEEGASDPAANDWHDVENSEVA